MVRHFCTVGTSLCSRCLGQSKWPFLIIKHLSQNIVAVGIWLQANRCLNNVGKQLWAPWTPSKPLICHSMYLRDHRWFKHREMGVSGKNQASECPWFCSKTPSWCELLLSNVEGEVLVWAHDSFPWPSSCTKPLEASSPFRQSMGR